MLSSNLPHQNRSSFTLIELLIVVAIIGILAAIAVPNFMNAQMRAKIARCYSDMHSLTVAIQAFTIDNGVMLVDIRDDDTKVGIDRLRDIFRGVSGQGSSDRDFTKILIPLTTPVSYMGTIPKDPFAYKSDRIITGFNEDPKRIGNDTYAYWDHDPTITPYENPDYVLGHIASVGGGPLQPREFILLSYGPDQGKLWSVGLNMGMPYNATNGLASAGEIFLRSSGRSSEN